MLYLMVMIVVGRCSIVPRTSLSSRRLFYGHLELVTMELAQKGGTFGAGLIDHSMYFSFLHVVVAAVP